MKNIDDNVVTKLRKLLAMGQDGRGNENEAETALRQAEALMRKHGLELSDVNTAADIGYDFHRELMELEHGVKVPIWINLLAAGIESFTDTVFHIVQIRAPYADNLKVQRVLFCGVREDVMLASWLLRYLMEAIDKERKRDNVGVHVDTYRKAAAGSLQRRMFVLREERNVAFQAGTGTALVVVDQKKAAVSEKFGSSKQQEIVSKGASDIAAKGRAAGERITLNQQVTNETREAISG